MDSIFDTVPQGFIMLPKITWNYEMRKWEEPVSIRVGISEIINYGPFHLKDEHQKRMTDFAISKVMVKGYMKSSEDRERTQKSAMLIVSLDVRDLDIYLRPLELSNTYRPH